MPTSKPTHDKPIISVIMPVYNAATTLVTAVESILKQSFPHWELIAVDDGSTDESADILKRYVSQDKRIRVIQQINKGPSAARNTGICHATGTWILFQDSDDLAHPEMLQKLIKAAQRDCISMVIGCVQIVFPGGRIELSSPLSQDAAQGANTVSPAVAARYMTIASPWCKLFQRSIIARYTLKFPEKLQNSEDLIFNLNYLIHAEKVALVDEALMDYRVLSGSLYDSYLTKGPNLNHCIMLMKSFPEVAANIPNDWSHSQRKEYGKSIAHRYFFEIAVIANICFLHKQTLKGLYRILRCLMASLPKLMWKATPEAVLRVFAHFVHKKQFKQIKNYLQLQIASRETS